MISFLQRAAFRKFKRQETRKHTLNYLFWECTTRCMLHCRHCGSDCSKESKHRDMPMEDFLRALDTITDIPPHFLVVITGGEPLMRPDIEVCGQKIRERGMRWSMVTNGQLYDAERHNSLLNAGMGALTISLDGLETSHNWMRNLPNSFERVCNAIQLAASAPRLNFDVVTCVNQRNLPELPQIKQLLKSLNVKAWRLFTIVPIGRAVNDPELHLDGTQFKTLMDFIAESRKDTSIDVKFSCEGYVGKYEPKVRDSRFFCRAGINIGSILIDGSISACPNIDRTFAQGNIYTDNFFDVWNSNYQPFREREWMRVGECKECKSFHDCNGNGFHNWHGDKKNVLVCHYKKTLR